MTVNEAIDRLVYLRDQGYGNRRLVFAGGHIVHGTDVAFDPCEIYEGSSFGMEPMDESNVVYVDEP